MLTIIHAVSVCVLDLKSAKSPSDLIVEVIVNTIDQSMDRSTN